MNDSASQLLSKTRRLGAVAALVGAIACGLGYMWSPERFFEAYLFALVVWSGIGLGCIAVVMLHHLVGGRWGAASRRILEAAAWPLVVTPLLAVPLVFGIETLYPWADAHALEHDHLLAEKAVYLNKDFFLGRGIAFLLVWAVLALLLARWSRGADASDRRAGGLQGRQRTLSALGLILYVLTVSFASIDWMMSLEPHWFSAIYGVIVVAGQGAVAFCVAISALCFLRIDSRVRGVATADSFQDLGSLLLASVVFWMYVTFSQFLIIWSGNLPEEVPWYLARSRGGWQWVALVVVAAHFAVPFMLLLSRHVRREPRYLIIVATMVSIAHVVDVYWLIMPALRPMFTIHWLDVAAVVAWGGVWKWIAAWRLAGAPLVIRSQVPESEVVHGNAPTAQHPA